MEFGIINNIIFPDDKDYEHLVKEMQRATKDVIELETTNALLNRSHKILSQTVVDQNLAIGVKDGLINELMTKIGKMHEIISDLKNGDH